MRIIQRRGKVKKEANETNLSRNEKYTERRKLNMSKMANKAIQWRRSLALYLNISEQPLVVRINQRSTPCAQRRPSPNPIMHISHVVHISAKFINSPILVLFSFFWLPLL